MKKVLDAAQQLGATNSFLKMPLLLVIHLFSLRTGTFSTERGMGQFISSAAFYSDQHTTPTFVGVVSQLTTPMQSADLS